MKRSVENKTALISQSKIRVMRINYLEKIVKSAALLLILLPRACRQIDVNTKRVGADGHSEFSGGTHE